MFYQCMILFIGAQLKYAYGQKEGNSSHIDVKIDLIESIS